MFRGSVIDSEFKGISTIEIMNLLGPDVATIGNHEVDYGLPLWRSNLYDLCYRWAARAHGAAFLAGGAFSGAHTEFYQLSLDMRVVWSLSQQAFKELSFGGAPLDSQRVYKVAISKYHFLNLKEFLDITLEEIEANGGFKIVATSYRDVIEEYFTSHQHLSREVEGRLVIEE